MFESCESRPHRCFWIDGFYFSMPAETSSIPVLSAFPAPWRIPDGFPTQAASARDGAIVHLPAIPGPGCMPTVFWTQVTSARNSAISLLMVFHAPMTMSTGFLTLAASAKASSVAFLPAPRAPTKTPLFYSCRRRQHQRPPAMLRRHRQARMAKPLKQRGVRTRRILCNVLDCGWGTLCSHAREELDGAGYVVLMHHLRQSHIQERAGEKEAGGVRNEFYRIRAPRNTQQGQQKAPVSAVSNTAKM